MGRRSTSGKADATGRTKKADDHHVRLYAWFMNTEAWASLTCQERVAYVEIERRFFGSNNGTIGLSARTLSKAANMSKDTAAKCFSTLIEVGFIECATPGGFSRKDPHASEWRLTRARCDATGEPASRAFVKWKPAGEDSERGPKRRTVRSQNKDSRCEKAA